MHEYFEDLNYTLANEDTWIEYALLPNAVNRVFSIGGSGARCLPLVARNPKYLDCVDLSEPQLYLVELRVQAARALSYDEWLFFLGYRGALPGDPTQTGSRSELFLKIKDLRPQTHDYWEDRKLLWESTGFIKLGKWERHFQKIGFLFRNILQCDFRPIFAAQSLEDQKTIYNKHWPALRWNSFLKIVASEFVFDRFLYKGHFSGTADRKTETKTVSEHVRDEFNRLFNSQLVRKNYFLQTLFLGEIRYEEGLPLEAQREIFEGVKSSSTEINYIQGSMLVPLAQQAYDFISLSDTISYLPEEAANRLLQSLNPATPKGALIVVRAFLKEPTEMDTKGWTPLIAAAQWAQKIDGTGIYRFQIYKKGLS